MSPNILSQAMSWPHAFDGLLATAPPAIWWKPPPICTAASLPPALKLVLDQNYLCEPAWPSLNYWSDPYDQAARGLVMQINLFARSTYGSSIVLDAPSSDSTARTTVRGSSAEQLVQRQAAAGSAEQPVSLYYWQLHVLDSLHEQHAWCSVSVLPT
jgi:hypothetical protein